MGNLDTRPMALQIALVVFAYLCGSVPFGLLLTRWLKGEDVRASGSGNIGATNVARVAGKRLGVVVLVLDALKGALPVGLFMAWQPEAYGWHAGAALAAVLGHVFPLWLKLRGGKGVATALGVIALLAPLAAAVGAAVYVLSVWLTRLSSLGSLLGGVAAVATAWLLPLPRAYPLLVTGLLALLLFTHRANVRRLVTRAERKL